MKEKILISAGIVSYNCSNKTKKTAENLLEKTKTENFKLYIIDNNSHFNETIKNIPQTTFIRCHKNIGFGAGHNKVLNVDLGKYHAVINPDIEIKADVLTKLVSVLEENPQIVMISPKVLNADGSEQKLPKRNPTLKYAFLGRISRKIRAEYTRANEEFETLTDIDFCSGCFFVIRSDVFRKIGGFDERFFLYLEDADITRRAKEYGRTVFCPYVSVVHQWERASNKSLKALIMHIISFSKYIYKWRKNK